MDTGDLFTRPEFTRRPERASHGLVLQIRAGTDVAAALRACAAAVPALAPVRIWRTTLPTGRDSPRAWAWRTHELTRAVPPTAAPVRLLTVRYADATSDLIVVAHRARLGRAALSNLARALTGAGIAPRALAAPARYTTTEPAPVPAVPAFGLGRPDRLGHWATVELPEAPAVDDASVLAAVAVVLARYGETGPIGLVSGSLAASGRDRVTTVLLPVAGDDPVAGLVERAAAAGAPPGTTAAVGVVLVDEEPAVTYHAGGAPLFPVTIVLSRRFDGTLSGRCLFDEGYLDPAVAAGFARHVAAALTAIPTVPPGTVADDLDLTPTADAAALDMAGRTPASRTAPRSTVDAEIAKVARRRPNAIACTDDTGTVTYRELDDRANRVAAALRDQGAGPGTRVGVCLNRGVQLIVVLLGVLKTGAAYVPMDPHAPADRLAFTVSDARPVLVVTDHDGFPAVAGIALVAPEALQAGPRPAGVSAAPPVGPDSTAYVIYTSGSTGRPKGVLVPHRNVLALLAATTDDLRLGEDDVWTWFHSAAFDFSVWEIWGCLLTGGRVVCVPHWVSRDPDGFRELLARERVTVLSQTPSAFALLRDADARASGELAVRLVVFGGEPLDVTSLRPWLRRHQHTRCRLVNMFGITETTVHVTARTLTPADIAAGSRSVGRALPGWSVSVRDGRGRPLPFGAAGEIYVGGAGVADGYLNRDELTAERFRPDGPGGERLYRTGDRGRLRPDGQLEHLGRLDNQVQLRGFRIELDEIRAVLLEDPAVTAAAVVVTDGPDGAASARIDAFVVTAVAASTADIRRRAARMLPDYMVPATVTALSDLPLTINGKFDVAKLPATATAGTAPEAAPPGQPPATTAVMQRVWTTIFGTEVRLDDDFFELGGNSLLAVRLLAAQRDAGLPTVSSRELYLRPTIADLADIMTGGTS